MSSRSGVHALPRFSRVQMLILALLGMLVFAVAAVAQDAGEAGHRLVLVRSEAGAFRVVGSRDLPGPVPRALPPAGHQGWSFQALDSAGLVIHTGALPNPHVIRGEFVDPQTGELSRVQFTSGEGMTFGLRVPLRTDVLVLYGVPVPAVARAARSASSGSSVLARIRLGGAP
jgi:hypothetical protein